MPAMQYVEIILWLIKHIRHMPCHCLTGCQADFTGGLYWPESSEGDVVVGACSAITPLFAAGPQIRRRCRAGGQWDQVDLTSCTAGDGVSSFAILWMAIQSLQGVNETTLLNNVRSVSNAINVVRNSYVADYLVCRFKTT